MSSAKTLHLYAEPEIFPGCLFFLIFEIGSCPFTSCTTYIYLSLLLGIQIDKDLAGEKIFFQRVGACKAGLFINSEERFNITVCNIICRQKSKLCSYTYTVVSTKGGAVGFDPVTFNNSLYRVVVKIVGDV